MTTGAHTLIREALRRNRQRLAHYFDQGPCQGPSLCPACRAEETLFALDRLVRERDEALRIAASLHDSEIRHSLAATEAERERDEAREALRRLIEDIESNAAIRAPLKVAPDYARAALAVPAATEGQAG